MRIESGVATDVGRVREGNEDAFAIEPPLYAVADGMGGHRGGEVASQLALQTVVERFRAHQGSLAEQVQAANRAVYERSASDRKVTGMGTTLTAAVVSGDRAHLVHVGDSRAYLLRAGALRQLTDDHTLVNRMVKAGEISAREAAVHPHRNVILRALGQDPDVAIDEQDVGLIEGDRLLLCSDGLTVMVPEDQLQAILEATAGAPQEAAERLVRAANGAGGIDNITVLVLDVLEGEPPLADDGTPAVDEEAAAAAMGPPPSAEEPASLRSRRWFRWTAIALGVVLALAVGLAGLRTWLDSQWYVGVSNGHVAIFQGIPADLFGFELSHVAEETDIPAAEAMALPVYAELAKGINANSREDAAARVEQIRKDLRTAQHQRQATGAGS
ncbi:MAG TPA: Stp1/IreP family PP2C-type Ser/Thr phosphatase [Actinomycetota bacterium]|nr:Stp1/IreP family PP2C-type Ser/Thr phosphatase [Actinomycetota bacterium]